MPHLTNQIDVKGPLIRLVIGMSKPRIEMLQKEGKPIPSPVVANFLIE
jgi:hypothetical protein